MVWVDLPIEAMDLPDGFALPDWNAPIDLEACLDRVPRDAASKGMFVQAMADELKRHGKTPSRMERWVAFRDYPLREVMEFIIEAGQLLHPAAPTREQLRRTSRIGYETFSSSMIGKVIFGTVGRDVKRIFRLAGRAFPHAMSHGKIECEIVDDQTAIMRASDVYLFADCFAPGIAEGTLDACGLQGVVATRPISHSEIDLWIRWV
jgi:uncharacterized protein (TIGR02265 family)